MALFTEENLIIPLTAQGGVDCSSNQELDSFNMSKYRHATIVLLFDATVTGDNILTLECGATDGADTSDATFHYRVGGADIGSANCDVLAADSTSAALTLTEATYEGTMLVLELDADELPTSGETTYNQVTVDIDGTATAGNITGVAILSRPRYAEAIMDTALA